jgi:hypothetical protein
VALGAHWNHVFMIAPPSLFWMPFKWMMHHSRLPATADAGLLH